MCDVLSGELKTLNASIAVDLSNAKWAKPNPIYKQKEITKRFIAGMLSLFLLFLV